MPEGDTLHKVAARLRPALEGHRLVRFEAPRRRLDAPRPGEVIEGVEARGKHLLVHFGGGLTLRTHLRMSGSWHLYRSGERWRRPRAQLRVLVEADNGWQAVCFAAPDVETYRRRPAHAQPQATSQAPAPAPAGSSSAAGSPSSGPRTAAGSPVPEADGSEPGESGVVGRLGPDLCAAEVDLDVVMRRLAGLDPGVEVGDALLDQRVASGIGNVYKSEACFACRLDPFTPLGDVDEAARRRLYDVAHRMLRANLGPGPRRTHPTGLAVYGKPGRPCPRCGAPIRVRRQGPHARSTYWCPGCQAAPGVNPAEIGE